MVVVTIKEVLTVMLSDCVLVIELASVTLTEKLLVPLVVGVPLIVPLVAFSARPAGRFPLARLQL